MSKDGIYGTKGCTQRSINTTQKGWKIKHSGVDKYRTKGGSGYGILSDKIDGKGCSICL
jgi:hypothetical protein